mgnify:CR=1 FL=1
MTKKRQQRRHAQKRALQRYGIDLTKSTRDALIKRIQSGDYEFCEKQSNRVTHFVMKLDGELVRLVYDKLRREIVTFLPSETAKQRLIPKETTND